MNCKYNGWICFWINNVLGRNMALLSIHGHDKTLMDSFASSSVFQFSVFGSWLNIVWGLICHSSDCHLVCDAISSGRYVPAFQWNIFPSLTHSSEILVHTCQTLWHNFYTNRLHGTDFSLSQARWIQSTPSQTISLRSVLISSSNLCVSFPNCCCFFL